MPRSSSGRWVARAGATGGGRTYRGHRPVNWYAALVLIVVLGLGSIVFARYEYERGKQADTIPPTTNTTWFAGLQIDVCGKTLSPLTENETDVTKQSFFTTGDGVIVIRPRSTADAGPAAVLGKFVRSYPDLRLTATSLTLPASLVKTKSSSSTTTTTTTITTTTTSTTGSSTSTTAAKAREAHKPTTSTTKPSKKSKKKSAATTPATVTYHNGESCPAGTKDAGKAGQVMLTYWQNAFAAKQTAIPYSGDPATLAFSSNQLITIGFVPSGTKLPKPGSSVVKALLAASAPPSTTTTTTTTTTSTSTTTSTTSTTSSATASTTTTTAP